MRALRTISLSGLAVSALAVVGCSSDPSTALSEGGAGTSLTVSVPENGTLDLRFEPPQLRAGERVTVQLQGLRLQSEAGPVGHTVRLDAPGRMVRRVEGFNDGRPQAIVDLGTPGGAEGGVTAQGPTSVHTIRVCQGSTCSEALEYDYDLHAPTGDGTTAWRTPDGRSVTIDRLRFELDAVRVAQVGRGTLTLAAPEPLVIIR